jgi:hypothetical protein
MSEPTAFWSVSTPALLNECLFDIIEPWLKGRVLEIGSTLNSISTIFVQRDRPIHLSTPDKTVFNHLSSDYQGVETVENVHSINIHHPDFDKLYPQGNSTLFDTILILNAMENDTYDQKVVRNAKHLLIQRGHLILLAPVFTAIYGSLKIELQDLKQYNRSGIRSFLTTQMDLLMTSYFYLPSDTAYDRTGLSVLIAARKK